jgi:hypothetical protein
MLEGIESDRVTFLVWTAVTVRGVVLKHIRGPGRVRAGCERPAEGEVFLLQPGRVRYRRQFGGREQAEATELGD